MLASRLQFDQAMNLAGNHILTGASEKRVSITFFPPEFGKWYVSNEIITATPSGITLYPGSPAITLNVHEHGDCVQREWYSVLVSDGGNFTAPRYLEAIATCDADQIRHFGQTLAQRNQLWPDMPVKTHYGN